MAFYENTIVAKQDLAEKELKGIISKYEDSINASSGKIVKTEEWGLLNLANKIKNYKKGFYIHFKFEGNNKTLNEIEKVLKHSVMVHKDHYMKWIEGEFDNDLPIASSGSTVTALLDIDNLFSAFGNVMEEIEGDIEVQDDIIYDEVKKYHSEKDTIFRKTFVDTSGIGYQKYFSYIEV